jgi:predicted lipid-binding transport protein (Tim44 family)
MDATTLVFALLAVFVIWKLRSVLGTRTGHEQPPIDVYRRKPAEASQEDESRTIVRFPANDSEKVSQSGDDRAAAWSKIKGVEPKIVPALQSIADADPQFDPQTFIDGAKGAYEMIVMSFAAGNRNALRDLLAKDVYDSFAAAISDRESRGETVDTTFVSIDRTSLEEAQLRGATAQITVRFQSKLITATRDRSGAIVDGNPDKVVDMIDIWTFARDTTSRDPNWLLVATETGT